MIYKLHKENIKVGDILYYQSCGATSRSNSEFGKIREVRVTKIGNKWIHYSSGYGHDSRCLIEDGSVDGERYISPGRVFISLEKVEEAKYRKEMWSDITSRLRHKNVDTLSTEGMETILAAIKPQVPGTPPLYPAPIST